MRAFGEEGHQNAIVNTAYQMVSLGLGQKSLLARLDSDNIPCEIIEQPKGPTLSGSGCSLPCRTNCVTVWPVLDTFYRSAILSYRHVGGEFRCVEKLGALHTPRCLCRTTALGRSPESNSGNISARSRFNRVTGAARRKRKTRRGWRKAPDRPRSGACRGW